MAVIHRTTVKPTKLELLSGWLPRQPWYSGDTAGLRNAGGFRLDDPAGEVGMEFMIVEGREAAHFVPLTYRGAPSADAERGLIGTLEHGVLGTRWVYDGAYDPVLVQAVLSLLRGGCEAQAQHVSHTPDPSVRGRFTGTAPEADGVREVTGTAEGTDIVLTPGPWTLRLHRVLAPGRTEDARAAGRVTAGWRGADGGALRAAVAAVYRG